MIKLMRSICFVALFSLVTNSSVLSQYFWEQTSGPEGGVVNCILVDKNNIIYTGFDGAWFGRDHNGECFYKSENEGIDWTSISMPTNKDIESISIDSSGFIYTWIGGGGVYKSTDNGSSWNQSSQGIDSFNDGILGVCKNNYLILAHNDGLYISKNGGNNWILSPLSIRITYLFIDSNDNIFAGPYVGNLYKSSDYGATWFSEYPGLNGLRVKAVTQISDFIFYLGTETGVFKSSDAGMNWTHLPGSPPNISSLAPGVNDEFYAGTTTDGFFVSNNGIKWKKQNTGLLNKHVTTIQTFTSNHIVIGTYGDGLFYSSDFGKNWQSINTGIKSLHITSFLKYRQYLFAGSQQGILYKSHDNGDSWTRLSATITTKPITCFGQSEKNSLFLAGWYYPFMFENTNSYKNKIEYFRSLDNSTNNISGRLFKSKDEGNSWTEVVSLYISSFANFYDSLSGIEYLLVAAENMGIYLSTDDGENWAARNIGLEPGEFVSDVKVNSSGYFFASSANNIYRSTNFGKSWELIYEGTNSVDHVKLAVSNNDYLYAGFDWGKIVLSQDNGQTWLDKGQNLSVTRINSIATDALNRVYIGNWWGQIFESCNYGENWTDIRSGMIGGLILNLFCDYDGNIFVGPYGGSVFRNVSSTFTPPIVKLFYPGLGALNQPVNLNLKWYSSKTATKYRVQVSYSVDFSPQNIIVDSSVTDTTITINNLNESTSYKWRVSAYNQYGWNTWSQSFRFKTTTLTSNEDSDIKPLSFNLFQNYPNPFNPSTKIKFTIPRHGGQANVADVLNASTTNVLLKIYDVLGNEVTTLVDEQKSPGTYEVEFNSEGLTSGIYFYKLNAGSYSQTKKMLLMK